MGTHETNLNTQEWAVRHPLQHNFTHVYYTDGSRIETQDQAEVPEYHTGVGLYFKNLTQEHMAMFKFETDQPILDAELTGLWKAVKVPPQSGEVHRHIYTDCLSALYLLQRALTSPLTLKHHAYEAPVRSILRDAANVKTITGKRMMVHFHKVKAHSGIEGNEIADRIAKFACTQEDERTPIPCISVTGILVIKAHDFRLSRGARTWRVFVNLK